MARLPSPCGADLIDHLAEIVGAIQHPVSAGIPSRHRRLASPRRRKNPHPPNESHITENNPSRPKKLRVKGYQIQVRGAESLPTLPPVKAASLCNPAPPGAQLPGTAATKHKAGALLQSGAPLAASSFRDRQV